MPAHAGIQSSDSFRGMGVYEPSFIVVRMFTVLQRVSYFLSVIFCCTFFTRLKNSFTARLGSLYHLLSAKERERERETEFQVLKIVQTLPKSFVTFG